MKTKEGWTVGAQSGSCHSIAPVKICSQPHHWTPEAGSKSDFLAVPQRGEPEGG